MTLMKVHKDIAWLMAYIMNILTLYISRFVTHFK